MGPDTVPVAGIITFAEMNPLQPSYSQEQMRRFLTEFISSPAMVWDWHDTKGRLATAVLLDRVQNPANDACLEILGIRQGVESVELLPKIIAWAKEAVPGYRSGFQVSVPADAVDRLEVLQAAKLMHHYDTYTMRNLRPGDLSVSSFASEIVDAKPEDRDLVYELVSATLGENLDTSIPDAELWKCAFLQQNGSRCFLWRMNGRTLGFATLFVDVEANESELRSLGVLREVRRQGIGEQLITHCLRKTHVAGLKACQLSVGVKNQDALGLYRRCGFEVETVFHTFRFNRKAPGTESPAS